MTVILDLFTLFTSVELCGLESIQNLILLVVVFNYEKILPEIKNNTHFSTENLYNCNVESFKKIILLIKNELSLKLGIFNFEINNTIFELYDKIIDIFRKKQTIELDIFFSEVFSFYLNNENL